MQLQPPRQGAGTNAPTSALSPVGPQAAFEKAMNQQQEDYLKQAQEPGVPLDTETGASPWERFTLSFRREKEDQVRYLQNKYGEQNVRLDPYGELIVRAFDEDSGKPRDILVSPHKMSAKDLIDLAGSVPEIAASILAIKGGRGIAPGAKGAGAVMRDVLSAAIGGEGAGAVKDIGVQGYDYGKVPDIEKITQERARMAVGDIALGTATMGAGRIFNWGAQGPLRGVAGKLQFDNLAGKEAVKAKYGIDVPQTIGEMTGSKLFSRGETMYEKLPGATGFTELRARQEEALRQLQSAMMGKTPPEDEKVGRALIDELMSKIAPAQTWVTAAGKELQTAGTKGIEDVISDVTLPVRQQLSEDTGNAIRAGVIARRDAVKAEADRLYDVVRNTPGGTGKVFPGADLQTDLKDLLAKLPAPETTKTVATGLFGPTNKPLTTTVTQKELLEKYVPPNILGRLNEVVNLKNPMFSLSDLQQMRTEVYDAIGATGGVPDSYYLPRIGKALTKAIDEGINKLPSGNLKSALDAANAHYRDKMIPFNRIGITELFKPGDEPGGVSGYGILQRVLGGDNAEMRYNMLKDTLGNTSPEFTRLKRVIADNIFEPSKYPGEELIDPNRFISNLAEFQRKNPAIADDIFGKKINTLFLRARLSGLGGLSPTDKVNARDFAALIASPDPTAAKLRTLVHAERNRDSLYKNEILGMIARGELPDRGINPVDFVNRFVGLGTPSEIKQVMDLIKNKPDLVDDVRAKVVQKVFRDAARPAEREDIGKLMSGDPTRIVTAKSVFQQLEDPTVKKKIETIVGPDVFDDLRNYLKIHAASGSAEDAYKSAGGIKAGQQITMFERNIGRFLKYTGTNWIISKLITNDNLRNWLGQVGPRAGNDPAFWSTMFTSPVFLREVGKEFPGVKGSMFIKSLKQGLDNWIKQTAGQAGQAPAQQPDTGPEIKKSLQEYLQGP